MFFADDEHFVGFYPIKVIQTLEYALLQALVSLKHDYVNSSREQKTYILKQEYTIVNLLNEMKNYEIISKETMTTIKEKLIPDENVIL
jgi:hypothetical protein